MKKLDLLFISFKNHLYKIYSTRHNIQNLNSTRLSAISSIEMILLLLVLVSIIVIFRSQITTIINTVFSKIRDQINDF
ncbi:MAG: hypothetical protein K2M73_05145 [Lachnospiraceae bacterium]|nr:hypothetical protein [Lachnospiraceae bacterium]MDE6698380.1 hypothetical protein [Lachnospiraceae bacterium]